MIKRGKIVGFSGSWQSGLATLTVENLDTGEVEHLPAESGPLGRALGAAFDAIGPGHTIDNEAIRGEEIFYSMDEMGLILGGFSPVDYADESVWEAYEKDKEESVQ